MAQVRTKMEELKETIQTLVQEYENVDLELAGKMR